MYKSSYFQALYLIYIIENLKLFVSPVFELQKQNLTLPLVLYLFCM